MRFTCTCFACLLGIEYIPMNQCRCLIRYGYELRYRMSFRNIIFIPTY